MGEIDLARGQGQPSSFGLLLRAARIQRGVSAVQLSAQLDLSHSYVARVEAGDLKPSLPIFGRIVEMLGLNGHEVLMLVRVAGEDFRQPELAAVAANGGSDQ